MWLCFRAAAVDLLCKDNVGGLRIGPLNFFANQPSKNVVQPTKEEGSAGEAAGKEAKAEAGSQQAAARGGEQQGMGAEGGGENKASEATKSVWDKFSAPSMPRLPSMAAAFKKKTKVEESGKNSGELPDEVVDAARAGRGVQV